MRLGKRLAYVLIGAVFLFVAACAGGINGVPETGGTPGDLPAEAVLLAQQYLADQLGVTISDVQILETEQVEWPDACLGLPEGDEACAEVITPGWRVLAEVNGQQYEVRTDDIGSIFRAVPREGSEQS